MRYQNIILFTLVGALTATSCKDNKASKIEELERKIANLESEKSKSEPANSNTTDDSHSETAIPSTEIQFQSREEAVQPLKVEDDGKPLKGIFLELSDRVYGYVSITVRTVSYRIDEKSADFERTLNRAREQFGEAPVRSEPKVIEDYKLQTYHSEIYDWNKWSLDKEYQLLDEVEAKLRRDLNYSGPKIDKVVSRIATFYSSYASASKNLSALKNDY